MKHGRDDDDADDDMTMAGSILICICRVYCTNIYLVYV